ncbi:MAG: aldehyde ferredoxin oxidoreductase C-terminal domain-containing protein [Bacteroidota bacterium]
MDGNLVRVDMRSLIVRYEALSEPYQRLGGRALTSQIIAHEVPPTCDPLGPHNKLVIAPGLLAGTVASGTGRLSIGAKSPLTGGIKESNAGGTVAEGLARLGVRGMVVEGVPQPGASGGGLFVLEVGPSGAKLVHAPDLRGLSTYAAAERLFAMYGPKVDFIVIGPAGEMKLAASGIAVSDPGGSPSRFAARGGLGAVMGSKGLKAVVVDRGSLSRPSVADNKAYKEAIDRYTKAILDAPQTEVYRRLGTAGTIEVTNTLGGLPTRSFTTGRFAMAGLIAGPRMCDLILERGGKLPHRCMPGCVIRCAKEFPCKDGSAVSLEYETLCLLGSNCEIGDLDTIAALNRLCNEYGLDTIDVGGAVGIAMQAGLIEFGHGDAAVDLVKEVGKGSPLGRLIGSGGVVVGKVLGIPNVPAVKGQFMAAYEPRAIKGLGVTYATSPMGADHTAGNTLRMPIDHGLANGQVEASRSAQIDAAVYDTLGVCLFVGPGLKGSLDLLVALVNARYGWNWVDDDLRALGKAILRAEIAFNRRAGIPECEDDLPEFFRGNPNPATNTVFDVPKEELSQVLTNI